MQIAHDISTFAGLRAFTEHLARIERVMLKSESAPQQPGATTFVESLDDFASLREAGRVGALAAMTNLRPDEEGMKPRYTFYKRTGAKMTVLLADMPRSKMQRLVLAVCIATLLRTGRIDAYTCEVEAWMAKVTPEEWEKDDRPPSERPDRMEVVAQRTATPLHEEFTVYETIRDPSTKKVIDLRFHVMAPDHAATTSQGFSYNPLQGNLYTFIEHVQRNGLHVPQMDRVPSAAELRSMMS